MKYLKGGWNKFTLAVVVISGISQIVLLSTKNEEAKYIFGSFACLTVLRIVTLFKPVKAIASTLFTIFPVTLNMIVVCFAFMYFFAVVGMDLFYGVKKKNF